MTALPHDDTLIGTSAPDDRSVMVERRTGPAKLVLMAGLPGSGKTTLALELERQGFLRLCPDERVWQEHGHYGRDFPRGEYLVRERPILARITTELRTALVNGRDVVMDHGFWTVDEREKWREVGEKAGANVVLLYLPGDLDALWERIEERNRATFDSPNAMYFSEDDLRRHARRFRAPGPDEPHLVYDGRLEPVLSALERRPPDPGDTPNRPADHT
ncbi:ATP-binding protein [Streptomyces sp. NPDC093109]|uniref:AAA family ATPase n=1 Tax=Streptomyces sp. NPDC093109 TaxID=3154977 RepID=UPI00344DCE77